MEAWNRRTVGGVWDRANEALRRSRQVHVLEALRRAASVESLERRLLLTHTFTSAESTALQGGMNQLADWLGTLSSSGALGKQVVGVATTLGDAADLKGAFLNQIYIPVANYLAMPGATDTGVATLLDTLSANTGNLALTVNQAKTGGGEISTAYGSTYEYELAFALTRALSGTGVDLGENWRGLNIKADASGSVTFSATANVDLYFGLGQAGYTPAANAFYTRFNTLSVGGSASATGMNFGIDIGMLGGQVSGGSLSVNALAGVTVMDPDADPAGAITIAELTGTPVASLATITPTGTANASFPVSASFGSFVPTGTPTLLLNSSNIYQSATNQMTYNTAFNQLTPFGSMGAADVLPAIGQIATSFATVISGSPLGTTSLPFVPSKSFGSLLDFAGIFSRNISDVLSSGGTATFHNAQTLQQQWATVLGVSPASLAGSYDPATHLLAWHIAKSEAMSTTSQ